MESYPFSFQGFSICFHHYKRLFWNDNLTRSLPKNELIQFPQFHQMINQSFIFQNQRDETSNRNKNR